jgi:hypothetical protein
MVIFMKLFRGWLRFQRVGITPHDGIDPVGDARHDCALSMFKLVVRQPFARLCRMATERAKNLLVAHLVPPVIVQDLELEQASFGRALSVEISFARRSWLFDDCSRRRQAARRISPKTVALAFCERGRRAYARFARQHQGA